MIETASFSSWCRQSRGPRQSIAYRTVVPPIPGPPPEAPSWSVREKGPTDRISSSVASAIPASVAPAIPGPVAEALPSPQHDPTEAYLRAADRAALALRLSLDHFSPPLARVASRFVRRSGWTSFGFARLEDHARERFGRSGRWVRDLAALGEALERLPGLARALTGEDGGQPIGRVAALAIARIATVESLLPWVDLARTVTVRDLKDTVRKARLARIAHSPGDPHPPGAAHPPAVPPSSRAPAGDSENGIDRQAGAAHYDDLDEVEDDLRRVRLPVPKPILAAFDEVLELYRAVEGYDSTITSFVESLVADAMAGDGPPDVEEGPVRRGPTRALVESALARSTDGWRHLPAPAHQASALRQAGEMLMQFHKLAQRAGEGGPGDLDAQMRELVACENVIGRRLGRLLAEMAGRRAWVRLRFAGTGHYAEERLGMARAAAGDRVRVERALRRLPLIRAAYEEGHIGMEAALLITRSLGDSLADRSIQERWIRWAMESTIKRLRDEARALRRRSAEPLETHAASGAVREPQRDGAEARSAPLPLDDAEWHRSLFREPGAARRRVSRFGLAALGLSGADADGVDLLRKSDLSQADDLSRSGDLSQLGDLSRPDLSPTTTSALAPDVFLQVRLPRDLAAAFLGAIESARRHLVREAEAIAWEEPLIATKGLRPSFLAARTFSIRCRRIPAWVGLLALLEEFAATWDAAERPRGRSRDAIYIRDGWRCSAPGCSSRRNLEDHHLVYRSRGGSKAHRNRLCLCRFHHQMGEHGGLASCRGEAPLGVVWRLGREPLASWFRNERRLGMTADVGLLLSRRDGAI